jgi:hypothetical protein
VLIIFDQITTSFLFYSIHLNSDKLKVKSKKVNSNWKRKASKEKLRSYKSSKSSRKLETEWNDNSVSSLASQPRSMTKKDSKNRKHKPKLILSSNELDDKHYNDQYEDTALTNTFGWRPKGKKSWFPGTHKSAFYSPDTRIIKFTFNDIVKKPNDTLIASGSSLFSSTLSSTPSYTLFSTPPSSTSTSTSTSSFQITDNKADGNDKLSDSSEHEKVKFKSQDEKIETDLSRIKKPYTS